MQEAPQCARTLGRRERVGTELLESVTDGKQVEPLLRVALEETDDLSLGERVPVLIVEKLDGYRSLGVGGPARA